MNKNTSALLPHVHLTDAAVIKITRIYRTIQTSNLENLHIFRAQHVNFETLQKYGTQSCKTVMEKLTEITIHLSK